MQVCRYFAGSVEIYLEAMEISVLKNEVQSILFIILLLHTITVYEYIETTRRRKMYMV